MGMTSLVLVILAVSVRAVSWADAALRRREERRVADQAKQPDSTIAAEVDRRRPTNLTLAPVQRRSQWL